MEKVWRLFYFDLNDSRWKVSTYGRDQRSRMRAKEDYPFGWHRGYAAIPGTIQKDGSITWPKRWPRP
jgi:hypothetical protein